MVVVKLHLFEANSPPLQMEKLDTAWLVLFGSVTMGNDTNL